MVAPLKIRTIQLCLDATGHHPQVLKRQFGYTDDELLDIIAVKFIEQRIEKEMSEKNENKNNYQEHVGQVNQMRKMK